MCSEKFLIWKISWKLKSTSAIESKAEEASPERVLVPFTTLLLTKLLALVR